MGIRLMIIELRKYNETGELPMEKRTTGLQAQVSYHDGIREAPVTRAAVCMGVKGMDGDVNKVHGHIQSASESGLGTGMHAGTAEQSEEH